MVYIFFAVKINCAIFAPFAGMQ